LAAERKEKMAEIHVERVVSNGNYGNVKIAITDTTRDGESIDDGIKRLAATVDGEIVRRQKIAEIRRLLWNASPERQEAAKKKLATLTSNLTPEMVPSMQKLEALKAEAKDLSANLEAANIRYAALRELIYEAGEDDGDLCDPMNVIDGGVPF
jgi:hypothetical protein